MLKFNFVFDQVVQGSYSYTGPDGILYTVNYIADENGKWIHLPIVFIKCFLLILRCFFFFMRISLGYRASGAHLPTAPPAVNVRTPVRFGF